MTRRATVVLLLAAAAAVPLRAQPSGPATLPSSQTPPHMLLPAFGATAQVDPLPAPPDAPPSAAPAAGRATPGGTPILPPDPLADRNAAVRSLLFLGWSVVAIVVFFVCIMLARRQDRAAGYVRIVRPPDGEAPPGLRAAWVGLVLPLAPGCPVPVTVTAMGAMSQEAEGPLTGYLVDGRTAVEKLAERNPLAAAWWGEHAPHVLDKGYQFLFATEACEPVTR